MTARTEQQRTVVLTERRAVGIGCNGIGGRLLLAERDVVLHTILLSILTCLLGYLCLEELQVVVRNGEVNIGLAIRSSIEGCLNEMLLHRGARAFLVVVEQQQALRQLTVVKAFLHQHLTGDGFVIALIEQLADALALVLATLVAKCLAEGKLLDAIEVLALEGSLRLIVGSIDESEHIFKHTRSSTTGGHKLHNLMTFGLVLVPAVDVALALFCRRGKHAVAYRSCSFEAKEWETGFELFELMIHLLFCDAAFGNLLEVVVV